MHPDNQIESPCINICRMAGNICVGCQRTLREIERWPYMTSADKIAVVERIASTKMKK